MATSMVRFGAGLLDTLGTRASTDVNVIADDGQTITQIIAAAQAWATALDAVTGAEIVDLSVYVLPGLPAGLKATPDANSRVEQTAVINMRAGASGHRYGVAIPGLKDALILAGKLDLGNAAVTTFVALLQGAALGGLYSTPAGNVFGVVVDAILSFRKRRKSLSRSSFEGPGIAVGGG